MIGWLIGLLFVGLISGAAARGLVPGRQRITVGATIMIGLAGSFVGGFLASLFGSGSIFRLRRTGLIGSVIGAVVVLLLYQAMEKRQGSS
jgi:uncharacterized membrane protein YeaQ/YmgE (transglycosylase-associated protein family)